MSLTTDIVITTTSGCTAPANFIIVSLKTIYVDLYFIVIRLRNTNSLLPEIQTHFGMTHIMQVLGTTQRKVSRRLFTALLDKDHCAKKNTIHQVTTVLSTSNYVLAGARAIIEVKGHQH